MDQNLEKRNENTFTKNTIANYVHDMKELEQQHFTLKETYAKCVSQRKEIDDTTKRQLDEAENAYQQATANLNSALKHRNPKPEKVKKPKEINEPCFLAALFVGIGPVLAISCGIAAAITTLIFGTSEPVSDQVTFVPLIIVSFIFLFIFNHICAKLRYKKYLEKDQKYRQYLSLDKKYQKQEADLVYFQNQYPLAQQNLERAKQQNEAAQIRIEKLDYMSKFLFQHISKIENQKKQLYTIGIVPPDYRKLDCLIEIDQMFRNDLVDTVREAVKIYEERVFRGELVRGIDNIYNMLGSLSASMYNIENTLYGIQREVISMSNEIYNISAATESFQNNMLSESRAARYATEALKKSQENCETYLRTQHYHI